MTQVFKTGCTAIPHNIPSRSACSLQHPVRSKFLLQFSYLPVLWNVNTQLYHPSGEVWPCGDYCPAHRSTPASASAITKCRHEMMASTLCATITNCTACSKSLYTYSACHNSNHLRVPCTCPCAALLHLLFNTIIYTIYLLTKHTNISA